MKRLFLICGAAMLLGVASVSAQDAGTPASGKSEQQQINDLSTQVAALTTRVARLEGERASAKTTTTGSAPTSTPASSMQLPSPVAIGDEAHFGDWSIIVKNTEERDQLQSNQQVLPHGIFVIVQMDVTNAGSAPQPFPWRDLRVVDSKGRAFGPSQDGMIAYQIYELNGQTEEEMQPGLTYAFPVVFDIAPDAAGLTLTSSKSAFAAALDR